MYRFVDMHCHLDFLEDPVRFARAGAAAGIAFYNVTVEPAGYLAACEALGACENVWVGAGLHPWWIDDGRCGERELEQVCGAVRATRFIGEVGLDFGKRCESSRAAQLRAFRAVSSCCAREGGKLLSVHAVKSAHAVLDTLEQANALRDNKVIFHWFSDSGDALARAVRSGCWFSVNPRMLATRRGRAYAAQIPANRLLIETDLPPEAEADFGVSAWEADLQAAYDGICELRSREAAQTLAERSLALLQMD